MSEKNNISQQAPTDADTEPVALNLPLDVASKIFVLAAEREIAMSQLINDVLTEYLNPDLSGTFIVFSTDKKSYQDEREARADAMRFAATGQVWKVAKVIGVARPQPPAWEEA